MENRMILLCLYHVKGLENSSLTHAGSRSSREFALTAEQSTFLILYTSYSRHTVFLRHCNKSTQATLLANCSRPQCCFSLFKESCSDYVFLSVWAREMTHCNLEGCFPQTYKYWTPFSLDTEVCLAKMSRHLCQQVQICCFFRDFIIE